MDFKEADIPSTLSLLGLMATNNQSLKVTMKNVCCLMDLLRIKVKVANGSH